MENLTELHLRQIERLKELGVEVPVPPIIVTIENTLTVVGKYGDAGEKINFVIDGISEKDSDKFEVLKIGDSDKKGEDGRLWPVYPSGAVERIKAKRRKYKTAKNVRLTESWGGLEKFITGDKVGRTEKNLSNEKKSHLSVIWTDRNGSVKYKDYPLNHYNEAFEKWYSTKESQIAILNPSGYEPSFSLDPLEYVHLGAKSNFYNHFLEWLVENLETLNIQMDVPEASEEAFWKRSEERDKKIAAEYDESDNFWRKKKDEEKMNDEMREPTEPYSIQAMIYRMLIEEGKIEPTIKVTFTKPIKKIKK